MKDKVRVRLSNFEMLRILCMYNILLCHLLFHGCKGLHLLSFIENVSHILECFLSFHVNAFLLISGYFGINFHYKSLLKFLLPCIGYSLLIWIIFSGPNFDLISLKLLLKRLMFVCRDSPWWFVEKYFYLFLTAPVLNICLKRTSKKELRQILFLLLVLNVGIGGFLHSEFNRNGFCYNHFVLMYMIGGYIRRFGISMSSKRLFITYILVSILIVLPPPYY